MDIKRLNLDLTDNPNFEKIISAGDIKFKLWTEFELWPDPWDTKNEFANIGVNTLDGRRYGINVWTFDFLKTSIELFAKNNEDVQRYYQIPPDLFVREMTRECLEATLIDLLNNEGDLEEYLNESIFGLNFLSPWLDVDELDDLGESLLIELYKELPKNHPLHQKKLDILAKREDNDDILVELEDFSLAVVHLTWKGNQEQEGFPLTKFYYNKKYFWEKRLKQDILDFQS